MRVFALILAVTILLSACNQQPQTQSQPETAATPASPPPRSYTDFPAGMSPDFAYKLRSRNAEQGPDGKTRRLVVEFKDGDRDSVDKSIEASLTALGYRRYKNFEQDASIVGDYGKDGKRVTVTTSPNNGALQLEADSKGTVYFVWKE